MLTLLSGENKDDDEKSTVSLSAWLVVWRHAEQIDHRWSGETKRKEKKIEQTD